jgi:hypothetical protein
MAHSPSVDVVKLQELQSRLSAAIALSAIGSDKLPLEFPVIPLLSFPVTISIPGLMPYALISLGAILAYMRSPLSCL